MARKSSGGLTKWFKEKWVDISRPKKGGGFQPCGRKTSKKGKYPKCVPATKAAGMTKADITPVIMDPSTLVAAFSSGKIVAAGIWYPNVEVIKNSVEIVELAGNADFEDKMAFPNAFVASNSVVEEYPEIVSIVQSVLKEANDYRHANLDKTIELVAKQLALEVDVVKKDAGNAKYLSTAELEAIVTDGTLVKWLDALNASFVKAERFDKAPDAASTFLVDSYLAAKVAE
jgi:NitT/TauT family transport system substrate-binding protein